MAKLLAGDEALSIDEKLAIRQNLLVEKQLQFFDCIGDDQANEARDLFDNPFLKEQKEQT